MKKKVQTALLATVVTTASLGADMTQIFAADTGRPVVDAETTLAKAVQTVESARQTMDEASQALQSAQADVTRLTSEKNAADQKLSDAQSELTKAQEEYEAIKTKADTITEEDINKAKQAVDNASNAVNEAETEADQASTALDAANAAYNEASTKLTDAQNAYNQALEAQQAAKTALEAAKTAETQAEENAKSAETEKNTAASDAKTAEEDAKSADEANPDAEKKAQDAKEAADKADSAEADAQKDADTAAEAKNNAETEKNTAEENAKSASDDVIEAEGDVSDKSAEVKKAEEAQNNSQTVLDDADKTLADETAKAGDAQKQADQEVKDQQAVVAQKEAEKATADQALTDAKNDQAAKQSALDDANAKLDAAKAEQTEAENDLKAKQDKLTEAQNTLKNAHGDVTSKKKAVEDAENAVKDAQAKVDKLAKEVNDLETNASNYELQVAEASKAVTDAEKAQKQAQADLTEARTIHKTLICKNTDDPLPDGATDTLIPNIPEAGNHKITYEYIAKENNADAMVIVNELNKTGKYISSYVTLYDYGYTTYDHLVPKAGELKRIIKKPTGNNKTLYLNATWTDDNGEKQVVPIEITTYGNDEIIAQEKMNKKLDDILQSLNLDGKTWKEKADAITKYVNYNYGYDARYYTAESMLEHGGGDCWASTNLIIDLAERAGFAGRSHAANYGGNGSGHENALLQDPDGGVYICEAGYVRDRYQFEGNGASELTRSDPDKPIYESILYKVYAYTDDTHSNCIENGEYSLGSNIGRIDSFHDETIVIPDDPKITSIGPNPNADVKEIENYFGVKVPISYQGEPMAMVSSGFEYPFDKCDKLKTVKIGTNITWISNNAFKDPVKTDIYITKKSTVV